MADLKRKDRPDEEVELSVHSTDQEQSVRPTNLEDSEHASKRIHLDPAGAENRDFARNLQALSSLLTTSIQPSVQSSAHFATQSAADPNYTRTIYLGGLPRGVTPADILHHVRGGLIERFRMLPEKNCAFIDFVDVYGAYAFYSRHCLHRFSVKGVDIKLGWANAAPLSGELYAAVQNGATRCIFLGSLDNSYNEYTLTTEFSAFGPLEAVNVISDKRIAFVQYLSISSALKAMAEFGKDPRWISKRIAYGKDHCANQPAAKSGYESNNYSIVAEHTTALNEAAASGNRTVYLGNLPEDISMERVCDIIKTGALHSIRYLPEKNCCFITFLEASAAQALYRNAAFHGIILQGNKLKPGWGKSGPLTSYLQNAIKRGATRTVYIGGISATVTVEELRKDFDQYGETEQIRIIREKNTAFVCFCNLEHAIRAIERTKAHPQYSSLKINFGKDRCSPSTYAKTENGPSRRTGNQS